MKKAASLLGVALELYGGGTPEPPPAHRRAEAPPPASPNDRITGKQLAAIQAVARRQTIGRERLSVILDERFQKTDPGHLTRREASALLTELTGSNGAHP